jgi:SPOR domain
VNSKSFLLLAALLISASPTTAVSQSRLTNPCYTLQVASFPNTELANRFVVQLVNAGEHPVCATVEVDGRGYWTRVFLGLFETTHAAGRYGDALVARGIIKEFLMKRANLNQAATRPRKVTGSESQAKARSIVSDQTQSRVRLSTDERAVFNHKNASGLHLGALPIESQTTPCSEAGSELAVLDLPIAESRWLEMAPSVDTAAIPRPDPIFLAFRLVTAGSRSLPHAPTKQGGLWLSGDIDEALARLRWIVGDENAGLITWDSDGRLRVDSQLLAKAAGLGAARVEDPLQAAAYISSNEGLLLIIQIAEGRHRYRLHIGAQAPTRGKIIQVSAGTNLDNNYDSRINPHRKHCEKLDIERPPEGFESLVGLNPNTLWFNLRTNSLVPPGEITFHELAEAHAKLELGLDYLDQGSQSGAHALALEREQRLKSQRPGAEIVLTAGSNLVLRTEQEIRLFYAEGPRGLSQR